MPDKTPFIVVDIPSLGLILTSYTRRNPKARADCVLESTRQTPDGPEFTTLAFLQGLPKEDFDVLLGELASRYGRPPVVLASNPDSRQWLYRYQMRMDDLQSPVLRFLVQFQQDFGIPWFRVKDGQASLAAAARDLEAATQHAERIRAHLARSGVGGAVRIERLGPDDIEAWKRLERLVEELRPQLDAGMGRPTWWKLSHLIEKAK